MINFNNPELKAIVKAALDENINDFLGHLYDKYEIKTGDIAPDQWLDLDALEDKMVDLIVVLMEQNKEGN